MNARMLLVTTGGLGLMRPAPGTWGSTPPPALALAMALVLGGWHWTIDVTLVFIALAFSIVCVRFGEEAEQRWGKKDPGQVVADETAGQAIALLALPWNGVFMHDAIMAGTAFVVFRLFDIVKPPPAYQLQKLKGGWGILVDDLFAGVYALIVVQVVARVVL